MDFVREDPAGRGADADYCRSVESYLCRKNDGHLIRIVGPAFERVCAWAERGIPLKIVYRGIDRYFERYYAKGPRRRPVRVEFCEADVLDVFDEWRRAVGVLVAREARAEGGEAYSAPGPAEAGPPPPGDGGHETADGDDDARGHRSRRSLTAHLERAIARLREQELLDVHGEIQPVLRELQEMRSAARTLRGAARGAALDRLRDLDAALITAARARLDREPLEAIAKEAEGELAPFRDRMPATAYASALVACADRIIRERVRLPNLSFD